MQLFISASAIEAEMHHRALDHLLDFDTGRQAWTTAFDLESEDLPCAKQSVAAIVANQVQQKVAVVKGRG